MVDTINKNPIEPEWPQTLACEEVGATPHDRFMAKRNIWGDSDFFAHRSNFPKPPVATQNWDVLLRAMAIMVASINKSIPAAELNKDTHIIQLTGVSVPDPRQNAIEKIDGWNTSYSLSNDEVARLYSVLADVQQEEWSSELEVEIKEIMAARKLAQMEMPTSADIKAIRTAIETGRIPPKSLPTN